MAIDALVEAGYDLERVPPELRARAERVLGLLDLLGGAGRGDERGAGPVVRTTLARIVAAAQASVDGHREAGGWVMDESGLAPIEQDSLEALVAGGYDPARVTSALRAVAAEQAGLLGLLATPLAEERTAAWAARREARIESTLAAVAASSAAQQSRMTLGTGGSRWSGLRKWDLVGMAAAVLLGGSLLMPMLGTVRENMRQTACLGNFQSAGLGLAQYGADFRGSMPMATASLPGTAWWMVGKDPARSNSANLFTLARSGYAGLEQLRCADVCESPVGHPAPGQMDWARIDEVSVSSQNLFSSYRPSMTDGGRMVVLADRSPLVLRAVRHGGPVQPQAPLANSPNHGGRGQNVLWTDGSSQWLTTPVLGNGDNLWLPLTLELAIKQMERSGAKRGVVILRGMDDLEPGNSFLAP